MTQIRHGTITGYYGQDCRCAECREAARLNYHAYKAKHPRKPCQALNCPRLARVGGRYCDGHLRRIRKTGEPGSDTLRLPNGSDAVGYDAAHKRLFYARGPARAQQCVDCERPAHGWAYIHGSPGERPSGTKGNGRPHGPYSLDPSHYRPMCARCHKIYDISAMSAAL